MLKLCSVEGCARAAYGRGWCHMHYMRSRRHGSTSVTRPQSLRTETVAFILNAIQYTGDECLLWPFDHSRKGYGSIVWEGKRYSTHRFVCQSAHGPAPSLKHETAHNCGVRRCINPRHLRWDTRKGNAADTLIHGTLRRGNAVNGSKLTDTQIQEIRKESRNTKHGRWGVNGRTLSELAAAFNVAKSTIKRIRSHKTWGHI